MSKMHNNASYLFEKFLSELSKRNTDYISQHKGILKAYLAKCADKPKDKFDKTVQIILKDVDYKEYNKALELLEMSEELIDDQKNKNQFVADFLFAAILQIDKILPGNKNHKLMENLLQNQAYLYNKEVEEILNRKISQQKELFGTISEFLETNHNVPPDISGIISQYSSEQKITNQTNIKTLNSFITKDKKSTIASKLKTKSLGSCIIQ